MNTTELVRKLQQLGVTDAQLAECLRLRKGIYPLPLYVKNSDNNYRLTTAPKKDDTIEGILLSGRGVILLKPLSLNEIGEETLDVTNITQAAHRLVNEKVRLLEEDDVIGSEGTVLSDLIDESSPLVATISLLKTNHPDIKFNPELAVSPGSETTAFVFDLGCRGEDLCFDLLRDGEIYLVIPEDQLDCPVDNSNNLDYSIKTDWGSLDIPDEYPLLLLIKDAKGEYRVRKEAKDGETVEGIVAREVIILREMIYPAKLGLQTLGELKAEAKKIHPDAIPLYFEDFFFGNGISNLLLIDRERYIQTAILLSRQGINMPDITGSLHYWALKMQDDTDRLPIIHYGWWRGQSTIRFIEQMLVCIPRNSVDSSCYDRS